MGVGLRCGLEMWEMLITQYQYKSWLLLRRLFWESERSIRGIGISAKHPPRRRPCAISPFLGSRPSLSRRLMNRNALMDNTLFRSPWFAASRTLNLSRHQP